MSGQPPRPGPVCGKHLAAITLHVEPGGGGISAAAGAREQTGRHVRSRGALTPTPPQGSRTKTDVSEPAGTGSEVRGQGRRRPRECRGPPGSALALWSTHETPPVWPEAGALVGCGRWACGAQPCREAAFNMATASPHGAGEARHPRGFGFRPELRHFAWEPRASAGCVRRKPHGRPRCQARRLLQPSPSQLPAGQRPGRRLGGLEKQGPFWNVENASEVHWDGCEVAVWEGRLVQDAEAPAPAPVLRPVPRG